MGHLPASSDDNTIGFLSEGDTVAQSCCLARKRKLSQEFSEEETSVGDSSQESSEEEFINGLGFALTHLGESTTASIPDRPRKIARLLNVRPTSKTMRDYIRHLQAEFRCSDSCLVVGLAYMERVGTIDPAFTVCSLVGRHMLATAVMLAAKFYDDVYHSNGFYAKECGLRVSELNALEAKLLHMLDWKMFVSLEEYQLWDSLVSQCPQ